MPITLVWDIHYMSVALGFLNAISYLLK